MHFDLSAWTRWLTYAYLVAVPGLVQSLSPLGHHNTARALQWLICAPAVLAWAHAGATACLRRSHPVTVALISLGVVLVGASISQAAWPVYAATEAMGWFGLVALIWVFATTPAETLQRELPPVVALAVLTMALLEVMEIGFAWLAGQEMDAATAGLGHASRRHFNHVQTMALVMAAAALWGSHVRWVRWSGWIGLTVGLALVWFTGARSTLLALLTVSAGLLALADGGRARWLGRLALLCLIAAGVYQLLYVWLPEGLGMAVNTERTMVDRDQSGSISPRLVHWQHAWNMALAHPVLGWGGLHYATQHMVDAAHPHNIVAQWLAEWGLLTTALILSGLVWCTRHLAVATWQRLKGRPWNLGMVGTAAWLASLAGLADALVSGLLTMPVSQVWWCVCLGVAMSAAANHGHSFTREMRGYQLSMCLAGLWLVLQGGLLWTTYHQTQAYAQSEEGRPLRIKPRLWLYGSLPSPTP